MDMDMDMDMEIDIEIGADIDIGRVDNSPMSAACSLPWPHTQMNIPDMSIHICMRPCPPPFHDLTHISIPIHERTHICMTHPLAHAPSRVSAVPTEKFRCLRGRCGGAARRLTSQYNRFSSIAPAAINDHNDDDGPLHEDDDALLME